LLDSAIAPLMIHTTGIAKFCCHVVADAIGNSAIDWRGGVVVEVDHASGEEERKVSTKVWWSGVAMPC